MREFFDQEPCTFGGLPQVRLQVCEDDNPEAAACQNDSEEDARVTEAVTS